MVSTPIQNFEQTVADLPVRLERTTTDAFDQTLSACLDEPAVGVPLPLDDLSLTDHPITMDPTARELDDAVTGVTPAGPAIAEYGTVVVPSDEHGAEQIGLYSDTHIAVVAASTIVESLSDAIGVVSDNIENGLTSAVLTTGPSVTADMGAPVYGAHGASELHIILVEDQ